MIRSADIRPRFLTRPERWLLGLNVAAIVTLVRELVRGWRR